MPAYNTRFAKTFDLSLVKNNMIKIYTDGACSGNKTGCGVGGYGYVIIDEAAKTVLKNGGSMTDTTNNAMELVSIIAALKELYKTCGGESDQILCMIHSDSKYVVDNWNNNLINWMDRGWLTSKGSHIVNKKYWELLFHMSCCFKMIKLVWVKGHDCNKYNEMANDIAVKFSQQRKRNERTKMRKEC